MGLFLRFRKKCQKNELTSRPKKQNFFGNIFSQRLVIGLKQISKKSYHQNKKRVKKIRFFFKALNRKEKIIFSLATVTVFASFITLVINKYFINTVVLPQNGGDYKEGIVGFPRFPNPALSHNNDPDRDIIKIVYSGLMKLNHEGNLVPDLSEDFAIGNYGKTYDFFLRKNVLWHDGQQFSADDVLFTIKLIQNPEYKSPLRINWQGVNAEKIDDWTVRFVLKKPYAPFLSNTTLGILPQHIWENVPPSSFQSAPENFDLIGTGPFRLAKIRKENAENRIRIISFEKNPRYYLKNPYLQALIFKFYADEKEVISAFNKKQIDGLALGTAMNKKLIRGIDRLDILRPNLPRYFAVFFNPEKNPALSQKNLRLSLAYATDKQTIIKTMLDNEGIAIDGPILPDLFGYQNDFPKYEYNPVSAQDLLKDIKKDELTLEITTANVPILQETASLLKKNWEDIGLTINLNLQEPETIINETIKNRNYEILIFGQVLSLDPDPFSFWHSTQKKDPGLNLAMYGNAKIDEILEKARQEMDIEKRSKLYQDFQNEITKELPAIFLYSPHYLYITNKKIQGPSALKINLPSDRFSEIENWYTKTKIIKIK